MSWILQIYNLPKTDDGACGGDGFSSVLKNRWYIIMLSNILNLKNN